MVANIDIQNIFTRQYEYQGDDRNTKGTNQGTNGGQRLHYLAAVDVERRWYCRFLIFNVSAIISSNMEGNE
jgi:hypothetical protein